LAIYSAVVFLPFFGYWIFFQEAGKMYFTSLYIL
jgi:hypothetical protein